MWILVLITFSGPMQINKFEVLEYYWERSSCMKRFEEVKQSGMPPNTNIGCVEVRKIKQA